MSDRTKTFRALSPLDNLRAIQHATVGTRGARKLHHYNQISPRTITAGLDVIARRWPLLRSKSEQEPIFVFSAVWRSGSTLLQRLIMSNEDVFMWGEPYRRSAIVNSLASQLHAFTTSWPLDRYFVKSFSGDEITDQWTANCYPEMQDYLDAHVAYFERLYMPPTAALGKPRWGVKEVTLSVAHARYLKWLFPCAKFIFLLRNPYNAYRSYKPWGNWYVSWPDQPVFTPSAFGKLWKRLANDYIRHHEGVDGILLHYESLHEDNTAAILRDYLGLEVAAAAELPRIGGPAGKQPNKTWVSRMEYFMLKRAVEPTAGQLGYHPVQ